MPPRKIKDRHGNEVWIVDLRLNGKRVRPISPVQTKKGAAEYERKLLEEQTAPGDVPTVKAFATDFLQNYAAIYNRKIEQDQKERVLRLHLIPAFGRLRLDEIDARIWATYVKAKLRTPDDEEEDEDGAKHRLHPTTINQHRAILRKLLSVAKEWKLISEAPRLARVEAPDPDFDFLSPEESARLVEAAGKSSPDDYTIVLLACRTGLRISELQGLQWDQVDLVAGTIRVRRSRKGRAVDAPKTKRERTVPLSGTARAAMKAHRHLRGPWVFCDEQGRAITRDAANWLLARAAKRAGLRAVSWRVLRHTCASQLVMAGRSLEEVRDILGHTSYQTTLRYAHLAPSRKQDAVDALDAPGDFGHTGGHTGSRTT